MKLFTQFKLVLTGLCLIATLIAHAHQGSIKGSVIHAENRQPVSGALILLAENNATYISNHLGNFIFTELPAGTYHLEITHIGFSTVYAEVLVEDAQTTEIQLECPPTPIDLEQITISAKVTHAQNIISGIDLYVRPVNSSQDLLRLVPGLFIAQHAGGGKAEQIFLRGFDIDHGTDVSIQVDGMPVNMVSHAHGQGYADLHFLIPETVQTIDFLKGPYQNTFSDFATAGLIHFKTLDALPANRVELGGGQFNSMRTLTMLNLPLSDKVQGAQSAYFAAEYVTTDGPFESPQNFHRVNVFGKYTAQINNNTILRISGSTFNSRWDASGQIPQRAVDSGFITRFGAIDDDEGGFTSRSNINFQLVKQLDRNRYISNQLYFTDYRFELYSNFTFFLEDSINGDMIKQKEHRRIYGYRSEYVSEWTLFGKPATSLAGMALRVDQVTGNELSHVYERSILLNRLAYGNVLQSNAGVYVNQRIALTSRLDLDGGVRYDLFRFGYTDLLQSEYDFQQVQDAIFSAHLNFDYAVNSKSSVYLYMGKGFHSNDTRVVVTQGVGQTLPGAYGADLGMRLKPFNRLIVQPAIWLLYLEQEFVYVGDAAIVEAGGKTMRKGVDLSLRYAITDYLYLDADLNYTHAENIGAGEVDPYIPLAAKWTSIGGITLDTDFGLTASMRYRYMGDRPANGDGSVIAEGYFVNDVSVKYTAGKWYAGVDVQNIFDVEWNEAQFETESRLFDEPVPVSELHFTPGTPLYMRASFGITF